MKTETEGQQIHTNSLWICFLSIAPICMSETFRRLKCWCILWANGLKGKTKKKNNRFENFKRCRFGMHRMTLSHFDHFKALFYWKQSALFGFSSILASGHPTCRNIAEKLNYWRIKIEHHLRHGCILHITTTYLKLLLLLCTFGLLNPFEECLFQANSQFSCIHKISMRIL